MNLTFMKYFLPGLHDEERLNVLRYNENVIHH